MFGWKICCFTHSLWWIFHWSYFYLGIGQACILSCFKLVNITEIRWSWYVEEQSFKNQNLHTWFILVRSISLKSQKYSECVFIYCLSSEISKIILLYPWLCIDNFNSLRNMASNKEIVGCEDQDSKSNIVKVRLDKLLETRFENDKVSSGQHWLILEMAGHFCTVISVPFLPYILKNKITK